MISQDCRPAVCSLPSMDRQHPTMRFDLHVHTSYSYDCFLSLETLAAAVRRANLDGLAVLDHDQIEGALRLRDTAPFRVIVGEEIGTADGGIGALFIEQRIPPHLSAEETISRIHEQNGLVFIPHPLSRRVPGRIAERKLLEIIDQVDLVEGYNARAPLLADDLRAQELAARYGIPVAAGSDAHFAREVGRAWTEIEDFETREEFQRKVRYAQLRYTRKTPYAVPLATVLVMIPALGTLRALKTVWQRTLRLAG